MSYEHRRSWIEDRVRVLTSLFSLQICSYAIMSNHYHLVIRLNPDESNAWSDDEVVRRWTALFKGPLLLQRFAAGETLSGAEMNTVRDIIGVLRQRLGCLSWFMKCLNEPIARRANAEDGCTGHFWESRFRSQALRSNRALFTAMAYVDLNPVRARMAKTPEKSEYTSLCSRLQKNSKALADAVSRLLDAGELRHNHFAERPLMPFSDARPSVGTCCSVLPMREDEYLTLIDVTGRFVTHGKRGAINTSLPPILDRLGLTNQQWLNVATGFEASYWGGDLRLIKRA